MVLEIYDEWPMRSVQHRRCVLSRTSLWLIKYFIVSVSNAEQLVQHVVVLFYRHMAIDIIM